MKGGVWWLNWSRGGWCIGLGVERVFQRGFGGFQFFTDENLILLTFLLTFCWVFLQVKRPLGRALKHTKT